MKKPSTHSSIIKIIKEQEIKFISLRFTDINGFWHQITKYVNPQNPEELNDIITIDASSMKGWKSVENSDIILQPDYSTFFIDPFCVQPTGVLICFVLETENEEHYTHDPRSIAKLAEEYVKKSKIGDKIFFGVEPEFFLFDDVKYKVSQTECSFSFSSNEMEKESNKEIQDGNLGHRVHLKGGYCATTPQDQMHDIRSEILTIMEEVGLTPTLHHHEVAQSQCEVGFKYDTLVKTADNTQKAKFVIKNVASSFGKTATFMPKPIFGENGSGMHVHQSIWKDDKNLFAGDKYGNLSEMALHYIAGVLHFAKSIAAFSNPTTNSYRRLITGFEAPVHLAYSTNNRSAGIRIPHTNNANGRRLEARFPDATSNPYLMLSAILMAGMYGIKNKLNPGLPQNVNLYTESDALVPQMPSSLEEALNNLEENHQFLLEGKVFTESFIKSYIKVKRNDIKKLNEVPHPIEFKMYYSY